MGKLETMKNMMEAWKQHAQCDPYTQGRVDGMKIAISIEEKSQQPAKWKDRAEHNDYIWAECSNCGFRVEAYKAVKTGNSSADYIEVKYNFCPICGKPMTV